MVDPGVLVIAGDLAEPHFVTGVREVLYRRALPEPVFPRRRWTAG
jgi:hypothetical protein